MSPDEQEILKIGTAYRQAILLLSACKEGIFEALAHGPLSYHRGCCSPLVTEDCRVDRLGRGGDARSEAWIVNGPKRIRAVPSSGRRVIIDDYLLDEDKTGSIEACLFSVYMLAMTHEGRCYSFGEYSSMLLEAGFQKVSLTLGPAPGTGLIDARKS